MSDTLTDEELMQAYKTGDSRAFETLYGRYSSKVYGYLRGKLMERATTDDVFQAVFLKLHKSRNSYDPNFPFAPWLFTVARSVLTDHFRKKNPEISTDPASNQFETSVDNVSSPRIEGIDTLAPREQEIVRWRYEEELSFDEMAKKIGTTPVNVRQILSRALRKLKTLREGL